MLQALGSASCDIAHTRQGVGFVTGIRFCVLQYREGGTTCYGQWVLRLVISHTKQGVRFVTGVGFYVLSNYTRE